MKKTLLLTAVAVMITWGSDVSAQREITVCGAGDSQSVLQALADAFQQAHPGSVVHVPDSIGSSGGIKMTAKEKCELGRVARPIEEREHKFNLHYKEFALSAVVFVANVKGVDGMSAAQISGIYSGAIRNWNELGGRDRKIYVVNREEGDSCRSVLEAQVPGFKEIKNFAGKVFYSTGEAVATVLKYRDTIGYSAMGSVAKTGLTVLKVDGVYPSAENVGNGTYKYVTPFAVVWKGELRGLSQEFFRFLFSPEGKRIIADMGNLPVQ